MMFRKYAVLSTVAAGFFLQTLPCISAAEELEEIIVTARKKEESILRVPVVENVVTGAALEQHQISDLTSLSTKVPGLSMGRGVLTIGPQISIRGVGTSTLDAGVDQSVSLNIDGLSMTQGLAYTAGLFDLAQVEVLKGPQALYFGKNSPGGVIALRTADPGYKTEVIARAGYEDEADTQLYEFIVSTPVNDSLGVRVAGHYTDSKGFFKNDATAAPGTGALAPSVRTMSDTRSGIWRTTAVWKPADTFDARLKFTYANDFVNGDAGQMQLSSCPDGLAPPPAAAFVTGGAGFFSPTENCKLDRHQAVVSMDPAVFKGIRNGGLPFLDLRQKISTVELNYRPENFTVTSVTGFYKANADSLINGTITGYSGATIAADNVFDRQELTQEFRFDTGFGGTLNYTGGLYYQDGEVNNRVTLFGNTLYGLPAYLRIGSHKMDIKNYSVFGQARWNPSQRWEVSGGVRWAKEKRSDKPFDVLNNTAVAAVKPEIIAKNYSPEIAVTYSPTDDMTIFGSLKQGYKSGSYTITTPATAGTDNSFGDEKVQGGEIGLKSRLLDHTMTFNVATYYYIYKGLQVGVSQPAVNGIPVILTLNAGEAKVYGVDLDMAWLIPGVDGLTLNAAANYNHARFSDLQGVPCYGGQTIALGCNTVLNPTTNLYTAQDLSGLKMVRAPDWQLNAGLNYDLPIGDTVKMNFGANAQYTSSYLTALSTRDDVVQKAYTLLGANVSVKSSDDHWELALIGNNLTNKITTGSCFTYNHANGTVLQGQTSGGTTSGSAGIDEVGCVGRPGRELWLRLTVKAFGEAR